MRWGQTSSGPSASLYLQSLSTESDRPLGSSPRQPQGNAPSALQLQPRSAVNPAWQPPRPAGWAGRESRDPLSCRSERCPGGLPGGHKEDHQPGNPAFRCVPRVVELAIRRTTLAEDCFGGGEPKMARPRNCARMKRFSPRPPGSMEFGNRQAAPGGYLSSGEST